MSVPNLGDDDPTKGIAGVKGEAVKSGVKGMRELYLYI
jgi:hypothetical protein